MIFVALTIGLVFNYILFWNRPLLLALGLPEVPVYVTLAAGVIKLALSFWLVPVYGVAAAGGLLSFYYVASVGMMVLRGIKEIGNREYETSKSSKAGRASRFWILDHRL